MIILSPLEQFITFSILQWSNLSMVYLSIIILFILLLQLNEFLLQNHIEWWYTNIKNIVSNHIFIIFTVWFFLLFSNLLGMIPFTSTLTAQFILVLSITIPLFISVNVLGFKLHGSNLFYLILPSGVPLILTVFISLLEFIAYFVKVISLTLRLSANMVAGHILIKILISTFFNFPFFSIFLLPIIVLELAIAILQAYVYITLFLSFYQDVLMPH